MSCECCNGEGVRNICQHKPPKAFQVDFFRAMPCFTKSGSRFLAFYSNITRSVDDEIEDNELGIDRRMLSNLHGNAGVDVLEVAFIPIMAHLFLGAAKSFCAEVITEAKWN